MLRSTTVRSSSLPSWNEPIVTATWTASPSFVLAASSSVARRRYDSAGSPSPSSAAARSRSGSSCASVARVSQSASARNSSQAAPLWNATLPSARITRIASRIDSRMQRVSASLASSAAEKRSCASSLAERAALDARSSRSRAESGSGASCMALSTPSRRPSTARMALPTQPRMPSSPSRAWLGNSSATPSAIIA